MNNKYWEEEIETMPREQLRELQLQRLKKTVSIAANSPYYKKVFQEHGITADSIRSIEDYVRYRLLPRPICAPIILLD